jgi:hypothetical protein
MKNSRNISRLQGSWSGGGALQGFLQPLFVS